MSIRVYPWLSCSFHDKGFGGKPQDCAGAVVFLCSPAARYLTGEIIVIDGGLTVAPIGRM